MAQRSNRTQISLPVFLVGGSNQGLAGSYAEGSVLLLAQGSIVDGKILTLDDGINPATVFEFDSSGDGVTSGRVAIDISGDSTAAQVAATTADAINGVGDTLLLTGVVNGANVDLTNDVKGPQGNVTTWSSDVTAINNGIVQPTGGGESLAGSGDAFAIADRQLGVVHSGHDGVRPDNYFISSGDTVADAPVINIVQGTPNSNSLSEVSAFGHTHKAVVKSAGLSKANVLSVATNPFELGRYEMSLITGVGTPVVGQRYALTVTIDGPRTNITHGESRETLQVSLEIPTGSNTVTYLLEQLAIKFNDTYSKYVGGQHNVVAIGLGSGGTALGGLTSSSSLTVQNTGTAKTLSMNTKTINSLNAAITAESDLSSTLTANTLTGSATLTGLLIVVFHEDTLQVVDTLPSVAASAEVTLGATDFDDDALANTVTRVSTGYTGTNTGRQVSLEFNRRARQLAFSLQNYVSMGEYPLQAPTYVDENAEGYNVTVIQAKNVDDKPLSPLNHHFQDVFIALPAAVSNPSADADTGYTIASTQTTTIAELNIDLTPWLASTDAEFKGSATAAAVFV